MALSDFEVGSLGELFAEWGYPRGNVLRLLRRYYNTGGESLDRTLISPALAERLLKDVGLRSTSVIARQVATDATIKLLVGLDGLRSSVECVLMPSHLPDRAAGCVSSQVGCAM